MAGITGAIQKGYTFSGTSPNNNVTAAKLNNLVDQSTITTDLITQATEKLTVSSTDTLLVYDPTAGDFRKVTIGNAVPTATGMRGSRGLTMFANTTEQVSIQASEILMRNSAGSPYVASAFSNNVDITNYIGGQPTPNGRDFTSEAANTWYYLYAISNGTVDRALISTSSTSPNLPTGFVYYSLLGTVRNDSSSNFVRFNQEGNDVACAIASPAGTASANLNPYTGGVEFTGIAAGVAGTFQSVDLSRCVPPSIVGRVRGILGHTAVNQRERAAIATSSSGTLASLPITTGLNLYVLSSAIAVSGSASVDATAVVGFTAMGNFDVPVKDSQQIAWASDNTAVTTNNMRICGFTLNL